LPICGCACVWENNQNNKLINISEEAEKNTLGSEKIMDKMFTVWILIIAFIVRRKLV
jgi:hypothetical protein